jgi:uncharacterized protein YndB with AHSA1/START domain
MTTIEKRPGRQKDMDGPADTRMMRIVHTALRRDLARTQVALTELAMEPDDDRREAVAAHLLWMMAWLHHHHEGEDVGLYPLVRARNPAADALLDVMDADHQRIVPAMVEVERAAAMWATATGARDEVARAVDVLLEGLLPHLQREEEEMMPVVSATITEREWRAWGDKTNVDPLSKSELAAEGLWIIDGLEGEDYDHVTHMVPLVPRLVISKVLVHGYRRKANRRWGLGEHSGLRLPTRVRAEAVVNATPSKVWNALTDVTRIGEWSHECHEAAWTAPSERAVVGARFRGRNRSGRMRWSRTCRVTRAESDLAFAYVTEGGLTGDSTRWTFTLEAVGQGTRIVQEARLLRQPVWLDRALVRALPSHQDRSDQLHADLIRLGQLASRTVEE